jgi:hypothetical protein
MEEMNQLLTIDLSVISEEYHDEWAFRIKELGFTLYADTKEEGPDLVGGAISTLLNSFGEDHQALFGYLEKHGVLYHVRQDSGILPRIETRTERTLNMGEMALPESEFPAANQEVSIIRHAEALVGLTT